MVNVLDYILINKRTGEVISDVAFYRTKNQQKGWQEKRRRLMARGSGQDRFVACFPATMNENLGTLSLSEAGALLKLLFYLSINQQGKLVVEQGMVLQVAYLSFVFDRSRSSTLKLLKSLEQAGVLFKKRENQFCTFYINEKYHHRGRLNKRKFVKLAIGTYSLTHIFPLKLVEAGFLYKLIPYLHFQTNELVMEPDEPSLDQVQPLNRNTIAGLLDCDPKRVTQLMNRLDETGVIRKSRGKKGYTYKVNRGILYRTYEYNQGF